MIQLHTEPATSPKGSSGEDLSAAQVEDLLRALGSTVRSYRLYSGNGPTLERFVEAFREKLRLLWARTDRLRLEVDEQSLVWEDHKVFPTGDATPELAFLFYKDGIREITLLPGFESEVDKLLAVLGRAPQVREDEDDLLTLLWQENFTAFKYEYVELAPEGVELGEPSGDPPRPIDPQAVRAAANAPNPVPSLTPEDFRETLYFLDEAELRRLQEEVEREAARDLWTDVLNALFDRLEDGKPERQVRIVSLLEEALPSMLATGSYDRAAELLRELVDLASRPGVLSMDAVRQVREVFVQLSRPETVEQLVQAVDGSPDLRRSQGLDDLLGFFPPEALAPLTRALQAVARPDARRVLETAAQRLAERSREQVVRLLADPDPVVVTGAARWVGSLQIGSATNELIRLLQRPDSGVRQAAIDALVELRAAVAGGALVALLDDPDRDVRVASARALGSLAYAPARHALEAALESKRLRAADRSEKIAFFEAFGRVGGAEAVAFLDRTLNAKSWLGRGESPEVRACAALGLARVRHPSGQKALQAAANDADPVVRSTVARALRGESS